METQIAHLIISTFTVMGAGVAAYVGVRVALAEIRKDVEYLRRDVDRMMTEKRASK
jgi:hypothetical protein